VIRRSVTLIALLLGAAPSAWAHDAPYSFLNMRFTPGSVEGVLTAHVDDLAHDFGEETPESLLAPERASADGPAMFALLARRLAIVGDGDTLRLTFVRAEPDSERQGVALRFVSERGGVPAEVSVEARLFPYDPQHETYVNAYVADSLRNQDIIDGRHPRITFTTGAAPRLASVVRRFIAAGIHHIFIGPDHILFVVGLLLLGGSLGRLLRIVTGFTIAHSITLALATLGILTPPARIIEPLIALSIVFVGVDNLRALRTGDPAAHDRRAWLAFGFGFVHGFGFASVLREFGLPGQALGVALFAFNVGVEIGQAAIVLATAPVLAVVRGKNPRAGRFVAMAGSGVVVLAGLYWLVERVLAG
jgi:HupE / UreJ protein